MSSAYIATLKRDQESTGRAVPRPDCTLQERFLCWYASLPEVSRHRPFSMLELEQAWSTQGKYLGPVLLRLGWTRHRRWARTGEYNRFWMPPSPNNQ